MEGEAGFVAVGRVIRPHGVRGAVKVEPLTDFPERFRTLSRVYLEDGPEASLIIEDVRFEAGGRLLVRFGGVETRDAAENLRGRYLLVPVDQLVALPEDSFYVHQLLGCQVETEAGQSVGRVAAVMRTGSNEVLVVRSPGGREELIPFIRDVIRRCEPAAARIVIRALPGLLHES